MSWMAELYRTYENNTAHIGDRNDKIPLVPLCHTTQMAQVNIVIDGNGKFIRASVASKGEAPTIIPATEKSAGRTSTAVQPHPLCDKLQYVAEDFGKFGGIDPRFKAYCKQLDAWCSSPYAHPKVRAVLSYIRKGRLIQDLVEAKVFHVDDNGTLLEKWAGKRNVAPQIFKVMQGRGAQINAFIRFSVEVAGDQQSDLWTDCTAWKSWADYYTSTKSLRGLCYVTGRVELLPDQHPKKIRSGGDGAKLISSDDKDGYTFRGRFITADEACGVGFEVTQKAHNALRWLIGRQGGWSNGEQAIVAWAVSGADIPDPFADTESLLTKANIQPLTTITTDTAQEIGIQLSKLIAGYTTKLSPTDDVVVMGLDSATRGRMAICFYRELTGSELLERVQAWHEGCCWLQRFGREKVFVGAPAPRDIAQAAYGKSLDANKTLRKATVERLLPCVIDGAPIPRDLVESCVRKAINRYGFKWEWKRWLGLVSWEWEKSLGIACALYNYEHRERGYAMVLEHDRKTRDYLFGRLLALAERMEGLALNIGGENRETNAGRLMQRFAERPHSTWLTIETSLAPYKARLRTRRPGFLHNVEKEIDEVVDSFAATDFLSDHRLTGEFLLGYHCQRALLWTKRDNGKDKDDDTESLTVND